MTKKYKEIRNKILEKEKRKKELIDRGMASKDVNEVTLITAQVDKINEDLEILKQQLIDISLYDPNAGEGKEEKRENDPGATPMSGDPIPPYAKRVGAPENVFRGNASFGVGADDTTGLALRSNENMVDRITGNERKKLDLGKYVRGAITGHWEGATEERSAMTTTTTGVIIPQILSAQIIDRARNLSLFMSSEVPVIPMETNNLTIARVASDPTFAFKEEGAEASESSFTLDSVQLSAKTGYGYAYVTREAINSAQNLGEILLQVFGQAMADMVDKAFLYGQADGLGGYDDFAPSGIVNDTDINVIQATNYYYSDFIKAIGAVKKNNGIPTVIGMNAETETQLALLRDANAADIKEPVQFESMKKIVSNQLAYSAESGSDALVFDPKAMIIGTQKNIVIRMFEDSDYCIKRNMVGFQIYCMTDCQIVQPKHITLISGYTGMPDQTENDSQSDDNQGEG